MDIVEFFQTVNRLCKNRSCAECPICKKGMSKDMCMVRRTVMLGDASVESIEKMISIVEEWAKGHYAKTRQSEFLKRFPNAKLDSNGVLAIRPCDIDSKYCTDDDYLSKCGTCAKYYWLTEVTDND